MCGEVLEALAFTDTPHRPDGVDFAKGEGALLALWNRQGDTHECNGLCLMVNEAIGDDTAARVMASTFAGGVEME